MKLFCGLTCGAACACLLVVLGASARDVSQTKRAVLRVTLQATVSKTWNTVTETTVAGCDVSIHSVGRRKVVLRSIRPTAVVVTSGGGRISYAPSEVRFVRTEVSGSGNETTKFKPPCTEPTVHDDCRQSRSVVRKRSTLKFVRSKRNEVAFRRTRLPEAADSCPRQSAAVRSIRPGLHQAEGELSEAALTNPRVPAQTALASADVDTDLDSDETGRITVRIRWSLTFAH
jgi:hypothetical protein